jgi:hypothetical protein
MRTQSALAAAAGLVALAFALSTLERWIDRRKPHELAWTVALAMFSVGAGALWLGAANGWNGATFRVFYLFGAVLNVPYLFQGEAYLLVRRRVVAHALLVVQVAASAFCAAVIWGAALHRAALRNVLPLGKDVFGDGSTPYRLAQYFSLPAYFLLLFALVWSAAMLAGLANVYFQDTQHLCDVGFQILFYATPIVYEPQQLGEGSRLYWVVMNCNPVVPFMRLFREPILDAQVPPLDTYLAACLTVLVVGGVASLICAGARRRLIFHL